MLVLASLGGLSQGNGKRSMRGGRASRRKSRGEACGNYGPRKNDGEKTMASTVGASGGSAIGHRPLLLSLAHTSPHGPDGRWPRPYDASQHAKREVGMASGGGGKLILSTFALLTTRDLIVCYLWIHRTRAHCADGGAKVLGVDHSLSARSLPRRNPG